MVRRLDERDRIVAYLEGKVANDEACLLVAGGLFPDDLLREATDFYLTN